MTSHDSPFDALADPSRRAILKLLKRGSRSAGEVAERIALSKPTLSHHFRVLEEAGLIRADKRGTRVVFTLQASVLEEAAAELLDLAAGMRQALGRKRRRAP